MNQKEFNLVHKLKEIVNIFVPPRLSLSSPPSPLSVRQRDSSFLSKLNEYCSHSFMNMNIVHKLKEIVSTIDWKLESICFESPLIALLNILQEAV